MAGRLDKYEQLSAYLDGELSPTERIAVDRLLASDPEARRILEELRQTSNMLRGLPKQRLPASAAAGLTARLERDSLLGGTSPGTIRPTAWWKPLSIAAAVLLACGVTYEGFVQLQNYRERRVFQLADAEYTSAEAPAAAKPVAAAPPPVGAIAVRRELSPAASPLRKDQIQFDAPASKAEARNEFALDKEAGEARPIVPPQQAESTQQRGQAASSSPILGDHRESPEKPADADEGLPNQSIPASGAERKSSVPTRLNPPAARLLKRAVTTRPTSQPATSQPTSQPANQGAARE